MKSILLAAAACGVLVSQCVQATDAEPPALAPFYQFADAMNAGDMTKAGAAYAPSATIIDEFAPHMWTSFDTWAHDADTSFKAEGVTELHIALSPPSFKNMDASFGYAVVPSVLTYKVKGKSATEKGMFTFSTAKSASGWHITGWAWSTL
jgi:hypothetical protein